MKNKQQRPEGEKIEYRTHHAEGNHEFADCFDVPSPRKAGPFAIPDIGDAVRNASRSSLSGNCSPNLLGEASNLGTIFA
jgi:hypothetical protein